MNIIAAIAARDRNVFCAVPGKSRFASGAEAVTWKNSYPDSPLIPEKHPLLPADAEAVPEATVRRAGISALLHRFL